MPRGVFALVILAVSFLGACSNVQRSDTVYRVRVEDPSEEKVIRRQLWRIGRAAEDVRVRYGLDDVRVVVIVTDLDGLGAATPQLDLTASVDGAKIVVNKDLFLGEYEDVDDVLTGLIAHEMGHVLHYARMSTADLADLGMRYSQMMKNPEGPQRAWVRAYERYTDLMAIGLGYGEELIFQKRASQQNLAVNDPPQVWDFYLTEDEIRAVLADESLRLAWVEEALDVLNLPSFRKYRDRVELDEDGDLRPKSGR